MKKNLVLIGLLIFTLASCHKSTCPAFDEHAGDKAKQGSTGKAKLQIVPKEMRRN